MTVTEFFYIILSDIYSNLQNWRVQEQVNRLFDEIGREKYIKLPKAGTNPRGVEITKEALSTLVEDSESKWWLIKEGRELKQVLLVPQEESITMLLHFTQVDYWIYV